jgi:predicted O-methyltransferase YrrM
MPSIRNVFACLVHERQDCVVDLVRNLRSLDPDSLVLLYNGGQDAALLGAQFPTARLEAVIHPAPRPLQWGHLHQFALDCMRWACDNYKFDTLTIVDSDQLAIRPGYSEYLGSHLALAPKAGVLGRSTAIHARGTRIGPAEAALQELDLWQPLLRQFPDGEKKFVHWCFWPSTVFTADAARDLLELYASNTLLQDIMRQTRIWATEEVILPTLAALLGYEIGANPCSYDYVQYRHTFTVRHLDRAFDRPDVFWMHPVPRTYEDALRRRIRDKWNHYETSQRVSLTTTQPDATANIPSLLLTVPVLERMRGIEGWLDDAEADLLLAAASRAIGTVPDGELVEVGSYCGRSTVVLGAALAASGNSHGVRIHAIDPHDGVVGALDRGLQRVPPTHERFLHNIGDAGIAHLVEPIVQRSYEVAWDKPISFLFIDGLHDYFNVMRDFHHFEPWLAPGGLVAFHDYADYYPGVKAFVDELLASGGYEMVHKALSTIVLRAKTDGAPRACESPAMDTIAGDAPSDAPEPAMTIAAPLVIGREPLVTCIMPTANRRAFAPQAIEYFLRQDYAKTELLILDDGEQDISDVIPADRRIRYERMDRRATMGAKHNRACELARGEIIVHWDDDDWIADWRLSYQVACVLAHPDNTLCGLDRLYFYDPASNRAWEYVYYTSDQPWVAGGTFCYRRTFWEAHRFPDMNEGADTVFVWGLRDAEIHVHDRHDFYVGLVHPTNTSRKRTHDPAWHPVDMEIIHGLLKTDRAFYEGLPRVGVA